jgi:cell division protein FtsQ
VLVALLVLVTVGAAAWALLASSLLAVDEVRVNGTVALAAEEVLLAAAVRSETPLLRLDTAAVERRVQGLRRVSAAEVNRSLTGTVEVTVTERIPVAVLPAPDGVHLVDATATDFATEPDLPPGLPALRVPRVAPGEPPMESTMGAAVEVLTGLPQPLRGQVRAVAAGSPVDVTLLLADDREVRWGAPDQGERKAAVLGALLTQPGQVYDVTTPDLPTIS